MEQINMDSICQTCPNRFECDLKYFPSPRRQRLCAIWPRLQMRLETFSEQQPRLVIPESPGAWRRRLAGFNADHIN